MRARGRDRGIGARDVSGAVVAAQLCEVVALEGFGELVQELHEVGGGLVGQIGGQAHQRQIVGLQHGALARLARGWSAGFGFALGALLRLLEAVAFALQRDDLGAVHEPVDEGDHAGGVGEDLVPFAEDFVGA